jgi:hypothetical protein
MHDARTVRLVLDGVSARPTGRGARTIGAACRATRVWTTGSGILGLLLFSVTSAAAQTTVPCSQSQSLSGQGGSQFESSAVADQLEAAWDAGDLKAASGLFTVDAVAASSSGIRWRGKAELAEFLIELWDPTQSGEHSRIETQSRCASDEQVVWVFRYSTSGATGSADLVVHGGQITHIFWSFVPPSSVASTLGGGYDDAHNAAHGSAWPTEGGASTLSAVGGIGLATIGLLVRRRRARADPRAGEPLHLLRALHKAILESRGQPVPRGVITERPHGRTRARRNVNSCGHSE